MCVRVKPLLYFECSLLRRKMTVYKSVIYCLLFCIFLTSDSNFYQMKLDLNFVLSIIKFNSVWIKIQTNYWYKIYNASKMPVFMIRRNFKSKSCLSSLTRYKIGTKSSTLSWKFSIQNISWEILKLIQTNPNYTHFLDKLP